MQYTGPLNSNKQKHGRGQLKFDDGDIVDCLFENDVMEGVGMAYFHKNNDVYIGNFSKNEITGEGVMIYDLFTYFQTNVYGVWKNGNLEKKYDYDELIKNDVLFDLVETYFIERKLKYMRVN